MKSLLFVVLLFGSTGCAFAGIGAGVGSAFPKTVPVTEPESGAPVEVRGENHETIASGRWAGESHDDVLVRRGDALVTVEKERVTEVRKRTGTHWLTGFLIGGAIDLAAGAALTYVALRGYGSGLSAMGGM